MLGHDQKSGVLKGEANQNDRTIPLQVPRLRRIHLGYRTVLVTCCESPTIAPSRRRWHHFVTVMSETSLDGEQADSRRQKYKVLWRLFDLSQQFFGISKLLCIANRAQHPRDQVDDSTWISLERAGPGPILDPRFDETSALSMTSTTTDL